MAEFCMLDSDPLAKRLMDTIGVIGAQSFVNRHNGEIDFIEKMSDDDIRDMAKKISHERTHTLPLEHIRVGLINQLKRLQNSKANNAAFKKATIKRQLDKLEGVDEAIEIASVIDYLYDDAIGEPIDKTDPISGLVTKEYSGWVGKLGKFIDKINKDMEGIDALPLKDKEHKLSEIMKTLQVYFDYAENLNYIDEYRDLYNESISEKVSPTEGSTIWKVQKLIIQRDEIKENYDKQILPIMAKILTPYAHKDSNKSVLEQHQAMMKRIKAEQDAGKDVSKKLEKANKFLEEHYVDEETMLMRLREVSKDIGYIDKMYSPIISMGDFSLALFAKFVKKGFFDAKMDLADFKFELQKDYSELVKLTGSKDSPHKVNEGLIEVVTDYIPDDNNPGEWIERKHNALIQEFDQSAYNIERRRFGDSIKSLPEDQRKAAWGEWFRENHASKPMKDTNEFGKTIKGIESIIDDRHKELASGLITVDEFNQWLFDNMYHPQARKNSKIIVTDENGDKKKDYNKQVYADTILAIYENTKTPGYNGEQISYIRDLGQPNKNIFRNANWSKVQSNPTLKKYHDKITRAYFKSQARLPENKQRGYILPYIYKSKSELLAEGKIKEAGKTMGKEIWKPRLDDTDIHGDPNTSKVNPIYYTNYIHADEASVDVFQSILNFEKMSRTYEAVAEIEPVSNAFRSIIGNREVLKDDGTGNNYLDAFAKKHGLETFIKKAGKSNASEMVDLFIEQQLYGMMNAEELLDTPFGQVDIGHLTSKMMGVASLTMLGGPELLKSTANWIQAGIQKGVESVSKEFINPGNVAWGEKEFIAHIPNIMSDFAKPMSTSLHGQFLDTVDFMQGEFINEYGDKVSGSSFKKLSQTGTWMFMNKAAEYQTQASMAFSLADSVKLLHNGIEINLLQAYELGSDGRMKLKDGVTKLDGTEWTKDDLFDFSNRLHAINKRLNGVYNTFDRGVGKKWAVHRLLTMFKGFLIPTVKRRFKKYGGDHELGGATEGFYNTFARLAVKEHKDLLNYLMRKDNNLSPMEKANIRRALMELSVILVLTVGTAALASAGNDDEELKKNWTYQFALYEATRATSELNFYLPVIGAKDQLRLFTSPSAFNGFAIKVYRAVSQTITNPTEEYKNKTGWNEKGDNKAYAAWLNLLGFNGNNITPNQATAIFHKK